MDYVDLTEWETTLFLLLRLFTFFVLFAVFGGGKVWRWVPAGGRRSKQGNRVSGRRVKAGML